MHGIYQGSHEAALFEAQGGMIGPGGFDHLQSVVQTTTAIETRLDATNLALNRLQGVDPAIGVRARTLCDPMLRAAQSLVDAGKATNNVAAALRQSDSTRFQGVILGQGGLGPEIGRTRQALVSSQLDAMAAQLEARGIEPRLIPSSRPLLQSVLAPIRQLPIDGREAAAKLSTVLVSMRLLLMQTAARASLIGRARLAAALLGIEAALVQFGSRLTTPIVIDRRVLHQIMGVPDLA